MTSALILLAILIALGAAVFLYPLVSEAMRRPMSDRLRSKAPGDFAELEGGLTHYKWHGSRSERVLVLVHGLNASSWVFDGLIRGFLGMRYRVLAYDLFGRGYSDRPDGRQTLEFHCRQLGQLLDSLGINVPVTLLGYSMGGAIATRFAATESDRVDRLILLAPAGMGYEPAKLLAVARVAGPFGDWLWGLVGPWLLRATAKSAASGASVITDLPDRIAAELGRKGYLAAILSSERHALTEAVADDHREIGAMYIPTLAIWGEADETIPVSGVGQLSVWNRQAHQEVIPGAPHSLAYTRPTQVLEAMRNFLREVPE
ncbi:MAG: alpha/beta hydrolase [Rhodobacterales bacterium]|nr:MAG: alpha/beta hydrolase [Rhodobacterales bacterium]